MDARQNLDHDHDLLERETRRAMGNLRYVQSIFSFESSRSPEGQVG